jgi:hypothetical protein
MTKLAVIVDDRQHSGYLDIFGPRRGAVRSPRCTAQGHGTLFFAVNTARSEGDWFSA